MGRQSVRRPIAGQAERQRMERPTASQGLSGWRLSAWNVKLAATAWTKLMWLVSIAGLSMAGSGHIRWPRERASAATVFRVGFGLVKEIVAGARLLEQARLRELVVFQGG